MKLPSSLAPRAFFNFLNFFITLLFSLLVGFLFREYCTGDIFPSVDLHSHIAVSERLREQILSGRLFFYDRAWFGGWSAFSFYGFLSHLSVAILSIILPVFSVRALLQYTAFFGVIGLPFTFHFATKSFFSEANKIPPFLISFSSGVASLWFLLHSQARNGVGGNAIFDYGMFAQVFGWHIILLFLGTLLRLRHEQAPVRWTRLGIVLALAVLFHPLSAAFLALFTIFYFILLRGQRATLVKACLLGAGLSSFWTIPFIFSHRDGILTGITQGQLFLLDLFFSEVPAQNIAYIDVFPFLSLASLGVLLVHRDKLCSQFAVLLLVLAALFTSELFMSLVPIPLPYHRLNGLLLLNLLCLFAALIPLIVSSSGYRVVGCALVTLLLLTSLATKTSLFLSRKIAATENALSDQRQVVAFFANSNDKGRIFFEWLGTSQGFPNNFERLMESDILERSGFETANGLFTQSAPAYRYSVMPMLSLGAFTTAGVRIDANSIHYPSVKEFPLLDTSSLQYSPRVQIKRLISQGISHIVAGSKGLAWRLDQTGAEKLATFGRYQIFRIGSFKSIEQPEIEPIGYYDSKGNLDFSSLALYFYSEPSSDQRLIFIKLDPKKPIPSAINRVVLNGTVSRFPDFQNELANRAVLKLDYSTSSELDRAVFSRIQYLQRDYHQIRKYLIEMFTKKHRFFTPKEFGEDSSSALSEPNLRWKNLDQTISIANLEEDALYKVNYALGNGWQPKSGVLYKGSRGQTYLLARKDSVDINYSIWNFKGALLGSIISCLAVLFLLLRLKKQTVAKTRATIPSFTEALQ